MNVAQASDVVKKVTPLWAPPPDLTISEWADAKRVLVSESSAEPGRWRTDRAPYQRGIMDSVTDPAVHTVVFMSSAQVGKSEIILNTMGYYIDQDPAPMLAVQPTLEMAEAFSKDRVAPMIAACPDLLAKVGQEKSRNSGSTIRHKKFPGGHITMSGANSPASLASRPVRIVPLDEVDRFPASVGDEGDPVKLAEKRSTTFFNRKTLITSTPTIKDVSRVERAFESGDQRYYNVPCPHCGEMHVLKFANLKWDSGRPETAHFQCPHCKGEIREEHRAAMLAGGEWVATEAFNGTASFHIWEAYSPWRKWSEIVVSFMEAKKTPETLQVWENTCLGEPHENRQFDIVIRHANDRTEPYDAEVPTGALVLTCGVDVQDNRLEASIFGWGLHETPYAVDHVVMVGNTAGEKVWKELDELLFDRDFAWAYGGYLRIACTCIDSGGHRTEEVYKYVEPRQPRRVWAIKGIAGEGHAVIYYPTKKRTAQARVPVKLHMVGTDAAKTAVMGRLALPPGELGRSRFPNHEPFDDGYFDQLTVEKCITEKRAGVPKRVWKKKTPSARNEALDCHCYALAALHKLRPNWRALEKIAEARRRGEPTGDKEDRPKRPRRKRKSFATSWKG